MGVVGKVWAPFKHAAKATGESVQKLGTGVGKMARAGINAVRGVGNSFVKHTNGAVRNITRGGRRRGTRRSSRRKVRRGSRRG